MSLAAGISGLAVALLILLGIPIGFALAIGTLAGQVFKGQSSLLLLPLRMFNGAESFPMVAIPLFILAGQIMNHSGISKRLVDFASALVGFIRGGLAHVSIVTSMFFAEMSGSAVADAAALGTVLIPAMSRKGYPRAFAAAVISSAATVAIIIPPSIPMILYAVTAEVSVAEMFIGGIIPGILFGLALMGVSYALALRYRFPVEQSFRLAEVWRSFRSAAWAFTVPLIILGGILSGVFTATEASGVAVVAALVVGLFIYREYDLRTLPKTLLDSAIQSAVVMVIVAASAYMGSFLSNEQVPQRLAQAVLSLSTNRWLILGLLNVVFLVAGMVLHSAAAIVMLTPIMMPLVRAAGIDPVHFGIMMTVNLGIGQQTPPVASVLLTTISIARVTLAEVFRYLPYFLAAMVVVLLLVTYIPALSLGLVSLVR
ncbi:MAG TPA: TRAP transporter large permease [Limnochordales bacterium]